jgi:perosamine synthetase
MIPITKPLIDQEDYQAICEPLQTGWLVQGPRVAQFEKRVAEQCGLAHAVATSSCTTALHLAIVAAGIGSGDRVIVPSFTYVATANAVEHAGARPVFVDIDPTTFNLSPDGLEDLLKGLKSGSPRAIIPVHLFGLCADMEKISRISEEHGLLMIEDAACALGSLLEGRHAGGFGLAGCFSFHPRKLITTGEGGMIVTDDRDMAERLRVLRDHGADSSDHARHDAKVGEMPAFNHLGYNYRMTDIQGSLGISQMDKLHGIIEARRALARSYDHLLSEIAWLKTPVAPEGCLHTFQSYVCTLHSEGSTPDEIGNRRRGLMKHLQERGISSRPGTHAVHLLGYYERKYALAPHDFPNAWMAHHSTITLPLYPTMTHGDQLRVAEAVASFEP